MSTYSMCTPPLAAYYSHKWQCFTLSFQPTVLPHLKCFLLVNIHTLYAKKNIAEACMLLYSAVQAVPF